MRILKTIVTISFVAFSLFFQAEAFLGSENVIICQGKAHQIFLTGLDYKTYTSLYIDHKKIDEFTSWINDEQRLMISAEVSGNKYEIVFNPDSLKDLPPSGFSEKDFTATAHFPDRDFIGVETFSMQCLGSIVYY